MELCDQLLTGSTDAEAWEKAVMMVEVAVEEGGCSQTDGGDEVLYGRAGLLWGLMNFEKLMDKHGQGRRGVRGGDGGVERLVRGIVEAGRRGRGLLRREGGVDVKGHENALMWTWHGKMYLGA